MKLLIVTVVEEFQDDILQLFKDSKIKNFSESNIEGFKHEATSVLMAYNWFPSEKGGAKSSLFFSFTEEDKIESLFKLIKIFNNNLETKNPIRAVVVPIEKYI
ncbi:MAG: hypothetical protein GXO84_06575 [Chlorobi bacterium]|nr:hypothetical protein [Chlorobiota bacterium]